MVELANSYRVKVHTLTPPRISVGRSLAPPRTMVVAVRGPQGVPGPEGPNIEPYTFTSGGPLLPGTGQARVYFDGTYDLLTVRCGLSSAPVGNPVLVDVNRNGSSIYVDVGSQPVVNEGQLTATGNNFSVSTFGAGDFMTIDVDSVGSVNPGADLVVTVRLRKLS